MRLGMHSSPDAEICIIGLTLSLPFFKSEEVARDILLGAGLLCDVFPIFDGVKLFIL